VELLRALIRAQQLSWGSIFGQSTKYIFFGKELRNDVTTNVMKERERFTTDQTDQNQK